MVQALTPSASARIRRALVTGATGFVGTVLCNTLAARGWTVRRALHSAAHEPRADDCVVGNIDAATDWREALREVDVVIHLAARTHVMNDTAADPLAVYRTINVDGTRTLATAARDAGVKRFIFLSSIKVNGEATPDKPFTETDAPHPEDAYGITKFEAEQALAAAAGEMETVVLRPALIYGPGVKGNFLRLMRAVERGMPLPLKSIRNRRSLLYVDNLVEAILLCAEHPAAAGQIFLLADDEAPSTPALVEKIAGAMKKPARLLPFPPSLLRIAGSVAGKSAAIARLAGSLAVDSGKIKRELDWRPSYSLDEGLRATAGWYDRTQSRSV